MWLGEEVQMDCSVMATPSHSTPFLMVEGVLSVGQAVPVCWGAWGSTAPTSVSLRTGSQDNDHT